MLVGENFRFGHRRKGDLNALGEFGSRWGFEVEIVTPVMAEGIVASSTAARTAVREGKMEAAQNILGRPFALEGELQTGTGLGRKLVVPTLNLKTAQELLPKNGVYATETTVAGQRLPVGDERGRASDVHRGWSHRRVVLIRIRRQIDERMVGGPVSGAVAVRAEIRRTGKITGADN